MKTKFKGLRARRLELGLTLEELGRKTGLTAVMVRSVELGAMRGSLLTRARVASALGIPLRLLISKEEAAAIFPARGSGRPKKPQKA